MLWLLGIGGLLVLAAGFTALLNWESEADDSASHWDLANLGGDYAMIMTTLAGIGITAVVFLAELRNEVGHQAYASVIGIFLMGLVLLIGTSVTYATTRNAYTSETDDRNVVMARRVLFLMCTVCFFMSVTMTLLGLLPLLELIRLPELSEIFSWVMLFVIVAGGNRLGAWAHALFDTRMLVSVLFPFQATGLVVLYRMVLVPRFPWLWPEWYPAVALALVTVALCATVFFIETSMIRFHGKPRQQIALRLLGPKLLPPFISSALTSITCVWIALAHPFVG